IPKLDASGKNWSVWKHRLEVSLQSKKLLGYLHGTKGKPTDPRLGKSPAWIPTTIQEMAEVTDYNDDLEDWIQKDATVWDRIVATLPDSLFTRLFSKSTAYEYYETLKSQFQDRSLVVSVEL
ncbi:hypothetical protein BDN67DRAFT_862871, partial [Paxillus ammoniavirescens]